MDTNTQGLREFLATVLVFPGPNQGEIVLVRRFDGSESEVEFDLTEGKFTTLADMVTEAEQSLR